MLDKTLKLKFFCCTTVAVLYSVGCSGVNSFEGELLRYLLSATSLFQRESHRPAFLKVSFVINSDLLTPVVLCMVCTKVHSLV